ncbi:hypothetical protein FB382_003920 [Nocardioides ginsengisegetis]|uniref:Uncharacterized protein n=1 Tax=Nocardioides ginsengisegetis TaxID=661491 RepID=A0A7W3IW20_9ACTN|nr:hypothetical protein [Nocardioides ginsengisegetis]MBA8801712.1 hypothetical protein [Nocardioides ginsengisegetis]MBA8805575.1 hypothetical protein [Nocardioides ginsengisegetis]
MNATLQRIADLAVGCLFFVAFLPARLADRSFTSWANRTGGDR